MHCVACSSSIENLMNNEFSSKGMVRVTIALLTHKMQATFKSESYLNKTVTPDLICDEVECIGFGCELLTMTEICN
jgi:hypothetical protein